MRKRSLGLCVLAAVIVLGAAPPASADITAFLGLATNPAARQARGVAIGSGFLAVGLEFEYAEIVEKFREAAPGVRMGSFNVLVQTPIEVLATQFYVTAGGGVYRERLDDSSETNVAVNLGGGAKIRVLGPLRLRLDYRLLSLRGNPIHDRYHRVYAGVNLGF